MDDTADGRDPGPGGSGGSGAVTAAERFLRAFGRYGVEYVFANLGTDHTPLLEAAAAVRRAGDGADIPEIAVCPHEFVAMSAAHGYAAVTGQPQVVLVHVDVGTQNLGAAMHNAHRANVPAFVMAGLAPVTDAGHPGARNHAVHYFQDVFDQSGIVREYCRWTDEYRPPADPAETVRRGLERATADDPGPVYVSATREALETPVDPTERPGQVRSVTNGPAGAGAVERLAAQVREAAAPLVVTSDLGRPPANDRVGALVEFAETAGAGVVEHFPTRLCFPRDHDLHAGFDPVAAFAAADLVILAASDVPWVPAEGAPDDETPVVQIDTDPSKPTFPRWPFPVDETVAADPSATLAAVADRLDPADGESGRERWRELASDWRDAANDEVTADRADGRLTPAVLSDALQGVVDEDTVVVEDAVTSRGAIMSHLPVTEPGGYHWKGGAGLGWAPGAAVGAKLANPESRVVTLVGDGSYLFANPTACAWFAAEHDAPTLTVVYDNRGWQAVENATAAEHPDGAAVAAGVPESRFDTAPDLSAPATAVDAHTRVVDDVDELGEALDEAVAAVDDGTPAVLDVELETA